MRTRCCRLAANAIRADLALSCRSSTRRPEAELDTGDHHQGVGAARNFSRQFGIVWGDILKSLTGV